LNEEKPMSQTSANARVARLERRPDGSLLVHLAEGEIIADAVPLRLFPLSEPLRWIALLDAEGRERALLESLETLADADRKLLIEELSRREFVPIIQRVTWVSGNSEPCSWKVETDRGDTEFVLKDENDIRRLGPHGVLVVDSHGIRYLIPNREQLDPYTKRVIEWYV
jgi:hypothetical protein